MKIDEHPFPANMVDVGKKRNALQTKVLTSQSTKEFRAVDPKAQITTDEAKRKRAATERRISGTKEEGHVSDVAEQIPA